MSHIQVFPSGPLATNCIVLSDDSGKAAIIDPAGGSCDVISDYIHENALTVEKILITHSHWDHIVDCAIVKARFRAPVFVHPEDAPNLERPGSDGLTPFLAHPIEGVMPDGLLQDGERLRVGQTTLQVLHCPGHAPGLVCFYCEEEDFLICGDLFFHGTIGTLAVPTAEPERMWQSLSRVAKLPPRTRVYPGHGKPTTLEAESWLSRAREIFEG